MDAPLLGLITIALGLVVTFAGYTVLRVVIAIVGGFAGFSLGAALVGSVAGSGAGATVAVWIGAILGALLVAWLAYAFYQVAVYLALVVMGYTLGAGIGTALEADGWLRVTMGVVLAVLLLIVALAANLPAILLMIATAFSGAQAVVSGVMVLTGAARVFEWQSIAGEVVVASTSFWWALGAAVLGVAGLVVQWRSQRRKAATAYRAGALAQPVR